MNCPHCGTDLEVVLTVAEKPVGPPQPIPKQATAATRAWLIENCNANPGQAGRVVLTDFCRCMHMIESHEQVEALPLKYVPTNIKQLREFQEILDEFANGLEAKVPFVNPVKEPPKPKVTGWRSHVIHFTKNYAGKHLGQLTPEELASWCREYIPTDSWTDTEGKVHQKRPESLAKDKALREALDMAMKELGSFETGHLTIDKGP